MTYLSRQDRVKLAKARTALRVHRWQEKRTATTGAIRRQLDLLHLRARKIETQRRRTGA